MGIFSTAIDLTLAGVVIVGGAIGVVSLALFGVFIQVLPFLIKLGAVAVLAYFGLGLLGII
jgi:hypothetical protein